MPEYQADNMGSIQNNAPKPGSGAAIASLVLGIVAVVFFWVPVFGAIAGLLGILFAALALKAGRRGISVAGIVTSIVGFFIAAAMTAATYLVVDTASNAVEKAGKEWEKTREETLDAVNSIKFRY